MKPKLSLKAGAGIATLLLAVTLQAQQDVTQPGDPIIASSSNSPGSEGVANAIDGQQTKYLNFDTATDNPGGLLPSGFVVSPSVGVTHVTGMTIQTANDGPERDPYKVTLEGSNDDTVTWTTGTWELITTLTNEPVATRFSTARHDFENNKPYRHYRWTVLETATPNTCCMQVAEVELLGRALPQDVTQPGDPIIASSSNSPGSEGVANAIDGQQTKYLNFDTATDNPGGLLPSGFVVSPSIGRTVVSGMTIQTANDGPERDPYKVTLEGSNDDTVTWTTGTWELITTLTNEAVAERFFTATHLFENVRPFRHYRWTVTETVTPNTCCMQVAEVELLGSGEPQDVTQPGDTLIASSSNSPGSEGVANAIDNQQTKYLNFDTATDNPGGLLPSGFVVTPSIGESTVTGMSIQTANDGPERDPYVVTLEGSNDDTVSWTSGTWELITRLTNQPVAARFSTAEHFFPNNRAYKHYRWTVLETATPNTCCMQVAEVELLAITDSAPDFARFNRYPVDTPALEGSTATLIAELNGPWPVQWYVNGQRIPGANQATYTTPPVTAVNTTNLYTVEIIGRETSPPVRAVLFTPSTIRSVGVSFVGGGANGAPTELAETDIAGFHQQAYWNNSPAGGSGSLVEVTNSNGGIEANMAVDWDSTGEWGSGTGEGTPDRRLLNGVLVITGARANDTNNPGRFTFNGVPAGNHSVIIYSVQVPLEFYPMDFIVETLDAGGNPVRQYRYIRPQNSDEYNPNPGYVIVAAQTPEQRAVGNMIRFDNVNAGGSGTINVYFNSPGWVDPPGGDPSRGPGFGAIQLLLNPPAPPQAPQITVQPRSANAVIGGGLELSVQASGQNITYQWSKDNTPIPGATSATFRISAATADSVGRYQVALSNPGGRVLSDVAVVDVVPNANISEGLVVHLKFDETSGTTAANAATGGQAGTIVGAVSFAAGKVGGAFTFNGTDTFVRVPDYTEGETLTASAWVRPVVDEFGLTSWGPVVNNWLDRGQSGNFGTFYIEGSSVLDGLGAEQTQAEGGVRVGPNTAAPIGTLTPAPDTWVHVALTADGVRSSLYINGQLVGSREYLGAINSNDQGMEALIVGAELIDLLDTDGDPQTPPVVVPPQLDPNATDPAVFNGSIDEVAYWNRALSGPEIASIYAAGNAGQTTSAAQPVLRTDPFPPGAEPTISVAREGAEIVITFANGTLETSTTLAPNSWQTVNAPSPHRVAVGAGPAAFFRVRGQ